MKTVTVLFLFLVQVLANCPPPELLQPCTCSLSITSLMLKCRATDVKSTFDRISKNLKNSTQSKRFNLLTLETNATEIASNATGELKFSTIRIKSQNLTRIHSSAFESTANTLLILDVDASKLKNLPKPYNLFDLFNGLPRIVEIHLKNTNITEIPANAFGNLTSLRTVHIKRNKTGNGLRSIKDNAFYHLNLGHLNLENNNITSISKDAFRFSNVQRPIRLTLNLNGNRNLDSRSFAVGSLEKFNRTVYLSLKDTNVNVVNETIFRPFLIANKYNRITSLWTRKLLCNDDCGNAWLVKDAYGELGFRYRVDQAYCFKGGNLFDKNFNHCNGTIG